MKVFISHSRSPADERLATHIVDALAVEGHDVFTMSQLVQGADLVGHVTSAIRSSDAIVAFPGSGNPNVLFEIGLATGADVPAVLVAGSGGDVPFDLMSVPYVQITDNPIHDAQEVVRRVVALAGPPRRQPAKLGSAGSILEAAAKDPDAYEAVSPTAFEDLVARFLSERGFDVEQPLSTTDRGYDLSINRAGPMGGRWLVECKKYSSRSLVPAHAVRQLYGVVQSHGAAGGILVASSGFTASARAVAERSSVALVGLSDLLEWTPADWKS